MTRETVAAVVEKLRVKSGLQGESRAFDKKDLLWRIGFFYDRDRKVFIAVLYRGPKQSTMGLKQEHVETRGKSQWMTGNTWRLTPAGVKAVVDSVMTVLADPRNSSGQACKNDGITES